MALHFVNGSRRALLRDFPRLYRFSTLSRLQEALDGQHLVFVAPQLWSDPFERVYLDRHYAIDGMEFRLPMAQGIYALCVSGTDSSEAFWKVYSPNGDGVRLSITTEKLLQALDALPNADVYIGKVRYHSTRAFQTVPNPDALRSEIESNTIGPQQVQLMYKKRRAFAYENEVRILIVPQAHTQSQDQATIYAAPIALRQLGSRLTLDPRIHSETVPMLKARFRAHQFQVYQSSLYREWRGKPIVLHP